MDSVIHLSSNRFLFCINSISLDSDITTKTVLACRVFIATCARGIVFISDIVINACREWPSILPSHIPAKPPDDPPVSCCSDKSKNTKQGTLFQNNSQIYNYTINIIIHIILSWKRSMKNLLS